jgi:hypothetical protein
MQELIIFGACEKDSSHIRANFILFLATIIHRIHLGVTIICEKRGKLVFFLDGESNFKWCSPIKILDNWDFKSKNWF